jgi:YVTN family beta-propeller protein
VVAGLTALVVGIGLVVATGDEDPATVTAAPNTLAVIAAATNRMMAAVPVGVRPGPLAGGGGAVWAGNLVDRSLAHVDTATRQLVKTIPLPATPTGVAFAGRSLWVAHGQLGQLSRVDPQFDRVVNTLSIAGRAIYFPYGSVAAGEGAIWSVFGNSTLTALGPGSGRRRSTLAGAGPAAVIVAYGSVWVANSGESSVRRFDPDTFEDGLIDEIRVGRMPTALASGAGSVWVANAGDDSITRIDPDTGAAPPIRVGDQPSAVAYGAGAVWVANRGDGTVSRIDPSTNDVVETIHVGGALAGIAVDGTTVWVAVQAP